MARVSHGSIKAWPPARFSARGPQCQGRAVGLDIPRRVASPQSPTPFLQARRFYQRTKDFQAPWDTRAMPEKSQRDGGTGSPKGLAVSTVGCDVFLHQFNSLKSKRIMFNLSFNSPTNSHEEPKNLERERGSKPCPRPTRVAWARGIAFMSLPPRKNLPAKKAPDGQGLAR
jgi:hypothetical protein